MAHCHGGGASFRVSRDESVCSRNFSQMLKKMVILPAHKKSRPQKLCIGYETLKKEGPAYCF